MRDTDLDRLETNAYRESFSDGVVDLFAGSSLIWIGACWLWLEAIAPLAAILPAALAPTLIPLRQRLIASRAGYVRWAAPRRTWERRQLAGLLALGIGALGAGAALSAFRGQWEGLVDAGSLSAAIPAVLITIPVIVLAAASGLRRLWGYAAVLLVTSAATIVVSPQPGWPLLAGGIAMLLTGAVLVARFLRTTSTGVNA